MVPSGAGYVWYYESGPGSISYNGGTYQGGSVLPNGGQNINGSNFTQNGRYRIACIPTGVNYAQPVLFEINVSDIQLATYSEQAQKFAAWVQPANGPASLRPSAPQQLPRIRISSLERSVRCSRSAM